MGSEVPLLLGRFLKNPRDPKIPLLGMETMALVPETTQGARETTRLATKRLFFEGTARHQKPWQDHGRGVCRGDRAGTLQVFSLKLDISQTPKPSLSGLDEWADSRPWMTTIEEP